MYQLSKDYEKLFDLLVSGESVVCFVDNSHDLAPKICRDVCLAKRSGKFGVQVSVRGTTYFGVYHFEAESAAEEKEIFVDGCQKINLEYVVPLRPELEMLRARVARLEEALRPFAIEADAYDPDDGDNNHTAFDTSITMGQLRVARRALEGE